MSEHPSPGSPDDTDALDPAREAEMMRQVQRMQQRHREGGMDPEPDEKQDDPAASEEG